MVILGIMLIIFLISELLIWRVSSGKRKKRYRLMIKSLYRLMEERVLQFTIQNEITRDQAASKEYGLLFLGIEFLDTKPWLAVVFPTDKPITVGRDPKNKISIRDLEMSRMHCYIGVYKGQLYLRDAGSVNGTRIRKGLFRKKNIPPKGAEWIRSGDVILIGSYRFRVRFLYGSEAKI